MVNANSYWRLEAGPVGIAGHLGEALMNESSALEPAEKRAEGHTGHENSAAYSSEVGPHLNMIMLALILDFQHKEKSILLARLCYGITKRESSTCWASIT